MAVPPALPRTTRTSTRPSWRSPDWSPTAPPSGNPSKANPPGQHAPTLIAHHAVIATALAVIAHVDRTSPYWLLAIGLLILGAGMGFAMTPATSAITSALPVQQQGVASAINDLSREVGGALGIAVIGSIMTAVYRSHLTAPGVPADVLNKAKDSVAVAAHIGGPVAASADTAFVDGVHIALYTAAGSAALAAVVVFLMLSRHGSQPDQAEPATTPITP